MDEDFDEFGDFVGKEYSSEASSDSNDEWEDEEEEEVKIEHFAYDSQDISVPLVQSQKKTEKELKLPLNWQFQKDLMLNTPALTRNIAFKGPCNHGKTSILSMLNCDISEPSEIEKQRELTLFPKFYSLLTSSSINKSYVFNLIDLPGHEDFVHFADCLEPVYDGEVLVVDAIEGLFPSGLFKLTSKSSSVVIINKIDRLITEQKLPPKTAAERLFLLIQSLEIEIERVVFASAKFGTCFSVESISELYKKFGLKTPNLASLQPFTEFVLTPIYKLVSVGLVGFNPASLSVLETVDIVLTDDEWKLEFDERIKTILEKYMDCEPCKPLIDAIVKYTPPPALSSKSNKTFLVIEHEQQLYAIKRGSDSSEIEQFVLNGDSAIPINEPGPGCWYMKRYDGDLVEYDIEPVIQVSIEPVQTNFQLEGELIAVLDNLTLRFPALQVKPQENGEYELRGTGEMYLDTVLYELEQRYSHKIKVGQPVPVYKETVSVCGAEESPFHSQNGNFSVIVVASPLPPQTDLEMDNNEDRNDGTVVAKYKNNSLVLECAEPTNFDEVKDSLIQGFEWSCIQGPLMGNEVTGTIFKIRMIELKASTSQVLPTMRQACQNAVLQASPRICEPVSKFSCLGPLQSGKEVYKEVEKRKGEVESDEPVPGTSLYCLEALLPTIDTFTLGVDVFCQLKSVNEARTCTQFVEWRVIDEDPLETEESYAREVLVKTRMRKGLPPLTASDMF